MQIDYQSFINEEIKRLSPMKPDSNSIKDCLGDDMILCPECNHVVCTSGEIEDWKEFYDFSIEPVIYCQICSQAIDIDEIANKKTD